MKVFPDKFDSYFQFKLGLVVGESPLLHGWSDSLVLLKSLPKSHGLSHWINYALALHQPTTPPATYAWQKVLEEVIVPYSSIHLRCVQCMKFFPQRFAAITRPPQKTDLSRFVFFRKGRKYLVHVLQVSNFRGSYVFGSRATYHCNPGFILWGNSRWK